MLFRRGALSAVSAVALAPFAIALLAQEPAMAPLVYSADPSDPWNIVHSLLLSEPEGAARPRPLPGWAGDDPPDFFFLVDPGPPGSGPRLQRLVDRLENEARQPRLEGRTIEARVLFQQDLWRIFDETFRGEGGVPAELRNPLGRLLARLSPTPAELGQLRPNWPDIASAFPMLEPGLLQGAGGWRELRAVFPNPQGTTQHAAVAGHRRLFRVFARLPPGASVADLGPPEARRDLPLGSQVVLVESPIALASTGELHAVPLMVGVELRQTPPPGRSRSAVRAVLHASRLALSRGDRTGGGLRAIPEDALVRGSLTCYGFKQPLEPLRTACNRCHGGSGRLLQTGSVGSDFRLEMLDPDNTREQEAVLRVKATSPEYRALAGFFRAPASPRPE